MRTQSSIRHTRWMLAVFAVGVVAAGCHTDMWTQKKFKGQQASTFFADGLANRPAMPGTVARGKARTDEAYFTGFSGGKLVTRIPDVLTIEDKKFSAQKDLAQILKRGKERFEIHCSPCHGALGDGNGMIAKRGFSVARPPGNYHTDRLRKMPIGHFYDVITNGFGTMYSAAYRVEPGDRWAIAAYIRVLQFSQNAPKDAISAETYEKLAQSFGTRPQMGRN